MKLFYTFLTFMVLLGCNTPPKTVIEDQSFNEGWLFYNGKNEASSKDFNDADWRKLNLPHDWAIEGPFDIKYNARTGGLPVHGEGWYRKHFVVDQANSDKRVSVTFDGAMNNSKVWVNGQYVGERPFGYMGFEFDITPHLVFGQDNVIAVQLTPEDLGSRWYSGAGLYRNVHIKYNNSVHVPIWGNFVRTDKVEDNKAHLSIITKVKNTLATDATVVVETVLKNKQGVAVYTSSKEVKVPANKTEELTQTAIVENPILWHVYDGNLYTAETKIIEENNVVDTYSTSFGIRTISFDKDKGFFLNNKPVTFNGVCMHHDLGSLGAAVNYRATERQMQIMKEMGVNALRTSHNPPSPEMLEVCDKLGILVIDEAFDEWGIGKTPNGYNKAFDKWHEQDLRDMIKRDRNHPSIVMWSIGNEILEQGQKDGWKVAKMLSDICHDEDSSRPTTAGFNNYGGAFKNKLAAQVDIVGVNYKPGVYAEIRKNYPDYIVYGSETSSQTSSRGVYDTTLARLHKRETYHVSSYDVTVGPVWAYPPDVEFKFQKENPFILGEFVWTGFDYLGEPTPYGGRDNSTDGYWNGDWPSHSSYFAPVDLAGFRKDRFYLYQSQWTKKPMVHVLPHWNWEGREGDNIPVFAYTNAQEAELFVNGKSYGKKVKGKDLTKINIDLRFHEPKSLDSEYRLSWNVPYQKGSLKIVAYNDGKAVAEKTIYTAKKATEISLEADRSTIDANGKDLSFITVKILDDEGHFCPKENRKINFKIEGNATLAGVDNGNQASLESFQVPYRKTFNGMCLLIVKSTKEAGVIKITATSEGLKSKVIEIKSK